MKWNNQKFINILIFAAIVIIVATEMFPIHYYPEKPYFTKGYSLSVDPDSAYKNDLLVSSMPYNIVKAKIDSIDKATEAYSHRRLSWNSNFSGMVSVGWSNECDTCDYAMTTHYGLPTPDKKYYLLLNDYLPIEDTFSSVHKPIFFKKKGRFYKKYLKLDSLLNPQYENSKEYRLTWTTKEIRYGVNNFSPSTIQDHTNLLIPLSKKAYTVLQLLSYLFGFAWIMISFRFILGSFGFFVFNLAKGRAFTEQNYEELFYASITLASIPVFSFLVEWILHLVYKKYYAADFSFYFDWQGGLKSILASLLVLLLARAIKKGYEITEEQDLTI